MCNKKIIVTRGVENKKQLDSTEWFIAFIICSTCFGHFYAHHQELETICVLLPPMVCDTLVAGCWGSDAGQQAVGSGWGMLFDCESSNVPHRFGNYALFSDINKTYPRTSHTHCPIYLNSVQALCTSCCSALESSEKIDLGKAVVFLRAWEILQLRLYRGTVTTFARTITPL
jgi:hypothetical protein